MATLEDTFTSALAVVLFAATTLPTRVEAVRPLDDNDLLAAQRTLAYTRRALDAAASLVAGEISHRSRGELGYDGLAQRSGFRTAEKLVQHATGSTAREALGLVAIGALVHDADAVASGTSLPAELGSPWLAAVGAAVAAGCLSVEAAQAIRSGLGEPSADVTATQLAGAVGILVLESVDSHVDRLYKRARELRDELDLAGVADRERQIHEQRSIRRVRRPNGLSRYIVDPDLEAAAYWDDLYDKLTAPRRGGPRFVSDDDRAWAEGIANDERSTEQYVHDAITALLRIAASGDGKEARHIVGSRQPSVRVLVTARALEAREGLGRIEGLDVPVSIATVERIACGSGTVALVFDDDGQALNVGREQRLFTARQRIALAARDGGCRWNDCDRPPSWCEAHHVRHWQRDDGRTDIADGILLCHHHHLLLHNNDWNITRDDDGYWLTPPASVDPEREPRLLPSRSAALRDLLLEPADRPGQPAR